MSEERTDGTFSPTNNIENDKVVMATSSQFFAEAYGTRRPRKAVKPTITFAVTPKRNAHVRCKIQGLLLKETIQGVRKWKPRWATIVDNVLYYSDSTNSGSLLEKIGVVNQDVEKESLTVVHKIYGASIISVKEIGQDSNGYVFEIQSCKHVTRWCADSDREMKRWVSALLEVIAECESIASFSANMANMFHKCHQSEKLFTEIVLRQMVKHIPDWKTNKQLMKFELLHAIDNISFYDDDLVDTDDVISQQPGESSTFDLSQLGQNIRKQLIIDEKELSKKYDDTVGK